MTKEEEQYKRAISRARKLLKKYAEGDESLRKSVVSAIDRAEDLSRWVDAPEREEAYSLRREISRAEAAGRAVRERQREAELRDLRERGRMEGPEPGSFKHELATRGTGRGPGAFLANPPVSTPVLLGLLAVGAGVLYLATRPKSTISAPTTPTGARCIGTTATLTSWANSRGVPLLFLPRETTPPTRSELVDSNYNPDGLVVVMGDTSFYTYEEERPTSRRDLRSDYCATVT